MRNHPRQPPLFEFKVAGHHIRARIEKPRVLKRNVKWVPYVIVGCTVCNADTELELKVLPSWSGRCDACVAEKRLAT